MERLHHARGHSDAAALQVETPCPDREEMPHGHGGPRCQRGFEIPAAVKSISVGLASFSCSFVLFPSGTQWEMEHAQAGLPPLCGEVKGEGGLVLLSKAALENERWGSSSELI